MNNSVKKIILLAGDILIMYFSLYLALTVRHLSLPGNELWQDHFLPFSLIFIFWIICFYISGLYNLNLLANNIKIFSLTIKASSVATIGSIIFFYILPSSGIAPKTTLIFFIIFWLFLFLVWRHFFFSLIKNYLPKRNVAFLGKNNLVEEIISELKQKPQLGFNVSFIVDENTPTDQILMGAEIYNNPENLLQLIKTKKITTIILAENNISEKWSYLLFNCLPLGVSFENLTNFYEEVSGKIPVEEITQTWFLENLNEGNKHNFDVAKRFFDIILAFLIFIITIPLWVVIGLIIKIESKGPIFFIQNRSGRQYKEFKIIKFRTMKTESNDYSPTTISDDRVTAFGSFLRLTRLDEIPQTINIIKGEMSFVGPRPERPELVERLASQIPFYRERMLVKPGLTGIDQISGEYHSPSYDDTLKKLQYDLFYIKNRSIYLDTTIVLKTIGIMLSRSGR